MDALLKARQNIQFIDLSENDLVITCESDLNDLMGLCYEYNANYLLLTDLNLAPDFFDLKTGLAGAALQKFANYQVKVAVIFSTNTDHNPRFRELEYELNRNQQIRFFKDREKAEAWLTAT